MSWTARLTKAPDGEVRLQFAEPLDHLDMDRATARHLAKLLTVAADGTRVAPLDAKPLPSPQPPAARARKASRQNCELDASGLSAAERGCRATLCVYEPLGWVPAANAANERSNPGPLA